MEYLRVDTVPPESPKPKGVGTRMIFCNIDFSQSLANYLHLEYSSELGWIGGWMGYMER